MNYLAHALLSGNDNLLLTGNMIGDFVKGKNMDNYPDGIKKGIILHRAIDQFTDSNLHFKNSVFRIDPSFGKYRFVIADIFYDHLLAKNWDDYSNQNLWDFSQWVYAVLNERIDILPEKFLLPFDYMSRDNWLYNYQKIEMVEKYLRGISSRSKYANDLDKSTHDLLQNFELFENDFKLFMLEIKKFVLNFR